jgi:K+-transporting ATPase ATPase C chain
MRTSILPQLRTSVLILLALTILTGGVYPALVTVVGQLAFPRQANGSLLIRDGQPAGSELIGQPFDEPQYFWGRLSATGTVAYNAAASSGSNYGPSNPALIEVSQARLDALAAAGHLPARPAPVDLVTASGSGLDPHVSVAAALYQAPRVAAARGLDEAVVRALVARYTEGRQLGLLGEPRVNVLKLNLALDGVK